MGEWFVWHHPTFHSLRIDASSMPIHDRVTAVRTVIDELVKHAIARRMNWDRQAPSVLRDVDEIFWGLVHHPLLQEGVDVAWSLELTEAISASLKACNIERGMTNAHGRLHDTDALIRWSKLAASQTPAHALKTATDKIAAMQASRLLWIVRTRPHSRLRQFIYQVAWRISTKATAVWYEIYRRVWRQ